MANDLQKLLTYIVDHVILQNDERESEIEATAVRDVAGEVNAAAEDTRRDAERLAPFFARGLSLARNGRLVVDDTTPEGDKIADAFARFMVAPNLATSESTNLGDDHYRYTFDINWQALSQLAQRAGVNLDAAASRAE